MDIGGLMYALFILAIAIFVGVVLWQWLGWWAPGLGVWFVAMILLQLRWGAKCDKKTADFTITVKFKD